MLRRIEVMEAELDAGGNAGMQDFRYTLRKFCKDCKNFATIVKISQSLRNFRYAHFFAMIAKFRYDSEIHCIAKFLPLCFGSKRPRFV